MFKKKMCVTRFRAIDDFNMSDKDIVENLARFSFNDEDPSFKEAAGFTSIESPYEGTNFVESEAIQGIYVAAVFRRDTRNVSSSAVKREVIKRKEQIIASGDKKTFSKSLLKEIKEDVTIRLLKQTPFKTDLIPFVFNTKTGVGYFFSTSKSSYSSFEDIFTRSMGVSIEVIDFGPEDFLSWLWWRLETNEMNQPLGAELTTGTKFSVSDGSDKNLSGSASDSEMRLAVSEGCNVKKMTIQPVGDEEFVVDLSGKLSGVYLDKEDMPSKDSPSVIPLAVRFDNVFMVVDKWREEYNSNKKNVEDFHASKKEWAIPSICKAAFDDI